MRCWIRYSAKSRGTDEVAYEQGWWNENHPGCITGNAGNLLTDNIHGTGDEPKRRRELLQPG